LRSEHAPFQKGKFLQKFTVDDYAGIRTQNSTMTSEHCFGHAKDVTSPAHSPPPSNQRVRAYTKSVVKLLKTPHSIQFVPRFDPTDRF